MRKNLINGEYRKLKTTELNEGTMLELYNSIEIKHARTIVMRLQLIEVIKQQQ